MIVLGHDSFMAWERKVLVKCRINAFADLARSPLVAPIIRSGAEVVRCDHHRAFVSAL